MMTLFRIVLTAAAAVAMSACASAPFKTTWKAPEKEAFTIVGQKIAALFVSDVEATRRNAEEAMAAEINARGGKGITAYSILGSEFGLDRTRAFERLRQAGLEKALVMRAAAPEPDSFRVYPWTGTRFSSFWGGYGWGWGVGYDPAYGYIDTLVSIETRLYDVASERLVWAGVSQFRNPNHIVAIVRRLAAEAFAEMAKEGLIE